MTGAQDFSEMGALSVQEKEPANVPVSSKPSRPVASDYFTDSTPEPLADSQPSAGPAKSYSAVAEGHSHAAQFDASKVAHDRTVTSMRR